MRDIWIQPRAFISYTPTDSTKIQNQPGHNQPMCVWAYPTCRRGQLAQPTYTSNQPVCVCVHIHQQPTGVCVCTCTSNQPVCVCARPHRLNLSKMCRVPRRKTVRDMYECVCMRVCACVRMDGCLFVCMNQRSYVRTTHSDRSIDTLYRYPIYMYLSIYVSI